MISRKTKYTFGDRAYVNHPDGEAVTVIALVLYEHHTEYKVISESGTFTVVEGQLSETKVLV